MISVDRSAKDYQYQDTFISFTCPLPDTQHNDLATLLLSPGESVITHLFHAPPQAFTNVNLTVFWVCTSMLACWTYGLKLPTGLFVPLLLSGAAFGRLTLSMLTQHVLPSSQTWIVSHTPVFALIGAASIDEEVSEWPNGRYLYIGI